MNYDAFGNMVSTPPAQPEPMQYVGQYGYYTDATGFVYVRARYYDPVNGTWINRDPIGTSGGLNLNGFVENNPVRNVDASGLEIDRLCKTCGTCGEARFEYLTNSLNNLCDRIPRMTDTDWAGIYDCAIKKYRAKDKNRTLPGIRLGDLEKGMVELRTCVTNYCKPTAPGVIKVIGCQDSAPPLLGIQQYCVGDVAAYTDPASINNKSGIGASLIYICVDRLLPCQPNKDGTDTMTVNRLVTRNIYGIECNNYPAQDAMSLVMLHEIIHGCGLTSTEKDAIAVAQKPPAYEALTQAIACCIMDKAMKYKRS